MEKQFNKHYHFSKLDDGDRFYFMGDKKKIVYQLNKCSDGIFIKTDLDPHWQRPTLKQKTDEIIFLRKTGTQ